ncbi:hypothetical protein [Prosthecomicrobium sp. N25]|uniref:hypothetical protein n=1 Tax=Prosthecomicrobium sp. N25 TaxID=3129254 RepID=UPI003076F8E3
MAKGLALSLERQERIDRLKRFLAPQVAELVDRSGDGSLLDARRTLVVAPFCDLRGFTAFSAKAPPEEVKSVLSDYYEALGRDRGAWGDASELHGRRSHGSRQCPCAGGGPWEAVPRSRR